MFQRLQLDEWRQFRSIDIHFHPRLTVLTGANGAGKTTLLNFLIRHFGWQTELVSTPFATDSEGIFYSSDVWETLDHRDTPQDVDRLIVRSGERSTVRIGHITYSNGLDGDRHEITVPYNSNNSTYNIQIDNQRRIEGIHIPSHRQISSYQQVQSIPTKPRRQNDVYSGYSVIVRNRYFGHQVQYSPSYYMKETLIGLAMFGYGNRVSAADSESVRLFEEFQSILSRMLPPSLGFKRIGIQMPEVVLETDSGTFSIDAVSGGMSAIIDIAWQIFMFRPKKDESFVVTFDEPENHLHPELQRRILSDLIVAFPSVQFIVATHSPFIVGSVSDSNVYVLNYDENRCVCSTLLDTINKAGSANEILRDVLGLEYTIPIWVETKLEELLTEFESSDFTTETIKSLRSRMEALGFSRYVPETIARLAELKDTR
jgi:predicted ATPase